MIERNRFEKFSDVIDNKRPSQPPYLGLALGKLASVELQFTCHPNVATRTAIISIISQGSAPPGNIWNRMPQIPSFVSRSSSASVTV